MINPQTALKPGVSNPVSRSVWFDIPVVHLSDAMSFYTALLGWDYAQMEDSVIQGYAMIQSGGELIGGLRVVGQLPDPTGVASPILYFTVDNLAQKTARAKELGAQIIESRVDLGRDRGAYQWIRDRERNLIGLWAPQ